MAPTCDSFNEETSSSCSRNGHEASSSSSTSSSNPRLPSGSPPTSGLSPAELMLAVTAEEEEDYDCEPFYGMFSSRLDEDAEDCWAAVRLGGKATTSSSIPEASETFQRAMQQLDGVGPKVQPPSPQTKTSSASSGGARPKDRKPTPPSSSASSSSSSTTKRGDRKSSKPVKKSASFTAAATTTSTSSSASASSSSSSASSSSGSSSEAARRRMSMPCMRDDKRHVQWADEAGVSDLVSVRLIRPRLAKAEEDSLAHCPGRSILRRLSGIH